MPWLKKDEVLLIHVPRCGGTSITQHHRVWEKAQEGKNLYYRLGLKYYAYRYGLLEDTNFPFYTIENLIACMQGLIAAILYHLVPGTVATFIMVVTASLLFLTSTFVWTAPISLRFRWLRKLLLYVQHYLLCGFGCDTNYIVGNNKNGILLHLTGECCLRRGYVTKQDLKEKSFSLIRNPYARTVSLYHFNKRGCESFDSFVRTWHKNTMDLYHKKGYTDSVHIYCHLLPMSAYTHFQGEQLVNSIIKIEDLKRLVASGWRGSEVPKKVQEALSGIPHKNGRKKKEHWCSYYTQETMDLVLEMYEEDFERFGYDKSIENRPELTPYATIDEYSIGGQRVRSWSQSKDTIAQPRRCSVENIISDVVAEPLVAS